MTKQKTVKTARSPNEEDSQIGSRLRLVRNMQGITQEDFAKQLDLSFQQLQKYESGKNRISARILYKISQITKVPLTFFFEGDQGSDFYAQDEKTHLGFADSSAEQERFTEQREDFFTRPETLDVLKAFYSISDEDLRQEAIMMLRRLAQQGFSDRKKD